MTLEEKVAQLGSVWGRELLENGRFSKRRAEGLIGRGIGQITRLSGGSFDIKNPKAAAEIANEIQRFLTEETRLGIPAIVHEECLSGFMARGATAFPQAIGLASTWDPELMKGVTSTIRRQMRAVGAHQGLSPVLDVARDPRWGRTEETLGEDPYLVARMGAAYIEGLQGEDYSSGVIATPKHFVAHGFSEGGRNCAPVHVPPRELREVFLLPFEAAVREAGARSLMNAYHEIDGVPCTASRELLTGVLRGEWGFRGFVSSDYGSIKMLMTSHRVASDETEAAIQALEAGIDVELPRLDCFGGPTLRAAKEGRITESTIDLAVSRVLTAKLLLGLFEKPCVDAEAAAKVFDIAEDRALALEAARKSVVLLKNDGLLPLSKGLGSIAVVGPSADSTRNLLGDYSYTAHLRCDVDAVPVVSVLKGIEGKVSKQTKVYHAKGCEVIGDSTEGFTEAFEAAKGSDVVVAVVGERSGLSPPDVSGEHRDRSDLGLPGVQEDLLRALHETGKPMVVVLVNGRPLSVGWIAENCSAVVEAWLPGEEGGGAVADILFGDQNPGGSLPISFPHSVGQIPVNYNRKPSSFGDYISLGSKPLYPFGHGLSYTIFEYRSLTITPEMVPVAGKVSVSCEIRNAGERMGDEVVQLYVGDVVASVTRPVMELKGFKRLGLEPGEKKRVTFVLSMDQLAFYDLHMRLVVEPGAFRVSLGSSSEDIRLTGSFDVIGDIKVAPNNRKLFSEVSVQ